MAFFSGSYLESWRREEPAREARKKGCSYASEKKEYIYRGGEQKKWLWLGRRRPEEEKKEGGSRWIAASIKITPRLLEPWRPWIGLNVSVFPRGNCPRETPPRLPARHLITIPLLRREPRLPTPALPSRDPSSVVGGGEGEASARGNEKLARGIVKSPSATTETAADPLHAAVYTYT